MSLHAVKILGISFTNSSKKEILEYIQKFLFNHPKPVVRNQQKSTTILTIVTPNPEQVVYARRCPWFGELLNQADIALPDGTGIVLAAKLLKSQIANLNDQKKLERIPGVGFMNNLVGMAAKEGYGIGLIGGRGGLAVKTLECLQAAYSGLRGWAEDGPEIEISNSNDQISKKAFEEQRRHTQHTNILNQSDNVAMEQSEINLDKPYVVRIAEKIRVTGVRMVFVGLGAPKQEYLIAQFIQYLSLSPSLPLSQSCVFMSVGGSFDEISGRVPGAPAVVNDLGVKWLWRLIHEPWRWRRQLALGTFGLLVLKEMMQKQEQD